METLSLNSHGSSKLRKLTAPSSKIFIRNSEAIYVLRKDEINYLKAQGNYTEIYTLAGQKIMSSKTLKYYGDLLVESQFIRVHQSYLINFDQLKELRLGAEKQVILSDGVSIPVSRSRLSFISSKLQNPC